MVYQGYTKDINCEHWGLMDWAKWTRLLKKKKKWNKRLKIEIITCLNKFQRRCDCIPRIFYNIFFFKTFVGLVLQTRRTSVSFPQFLFSRYVKRDLVQFFIFLNKNFLFTLENLLQLFYLKSVNFFSWWYVLSTFWT